MRLPPRLPPRVALLGLLLVSAVAAIAYVVCPARLTASNAGLTVDCARPSAVVLGVAVLALAGLGVSTLDRRVRVLAVALALLLLAGMADLLSYRVTAGREALSVRRALAQTDLPWSEITRSRPLGDSLAITDTRGRNLRIGLARLSPEQRAALERVLARRIWESGDTVR
jgi:hypothetical protein